ncbi:MAG: hypothetical protein OXO49_02070 [Gammaproteobacteria bacterium]|nr:hypothetical protein [Gammaproteobacteria bacterium]MDE0251291.1 hypothetical protein [Gammaproteobacteria bacterium]MDE0402024.1 hypothetical protein [Gammaproteobacteria bacterium]
MMINNWMSLFASLASSLAWPVLILLLCCKFRNNLDEFLQHVTKVNAYGVQVERDSKTIRAKAERNGVKDQAIDEEYKQTLKQTVATNPREAILTAWYQLQRTAVLKYHELSRKQGKDQVAPSEALAFFEYSSALTPNSAEALRDLRFLRNQLVHQSIDNISKTTAEEFVAATRSLIYQIKAMTDTPAVDLVLLTFLILQYNKLLDRGICNDITIEDVHNHIENGTILRFIDEEARRVGDSLNLKIFLKAEADEQTFEEYYVKYLQATYGAYAGDERRRWGVENNGLCLLIAWTVEIIQQGGGWVPRENVAGLHE